MDENRSEDSEHGTGGAKSSDEAAAQSPAMGLNDNRVFLGRELHIQTENVRFPAPHIVTQVFSGGRILLTRKSDPPVDGGEDSSQQQTQELMELMRLQHQGVIGELSEKQRKLQGDQ